MKARSVILSAWLASLVPSTASAQTARAASEGEAGAPPETTVAVEHCAATARCRTHALALPATLGKHAVEPIALAGGVNVTLVTAPAADGTGRYVVGRAEDGGSVLERLRGYVERPRDGEPGERKEKVLLREAGPAGHETLIVGTRYESATACGLPVVMNAKRLEPGTLEWQPRENLVFSAADRARMTPLFAVRAPSAWSPALPRLLMSRVSSSAASGTHGALTDGRLETSWVEKGSGAGSGELVVMAASRHVPIEGFQLVVRAHSGERRPAPRTFQLATDSAVFSVTMPEDAWLSESGATYDVRLPAPVATECVALVLDGAYAGGPDDLGIAELRAITSLDDAGATPAALVRLLDGSLASSLAARTLLERGGIEALGAIASAYTSLSASGKERALSVAESGGCLESAAFFVDRLVGAGQPASWEPELDVPRERASGWLRRCREYSRAALEAKVASRAVDRERGLAARELGLLLPGQAVGSLVAALDGASPALRRELRSALGVAARAPRARTELEALFVAGAFDARPLAVKIDLLRAPGEDLGTLGGAADALERAVGADQSFRTRYLLQQPLGALARRGDARAAQRLSGALRSDDSAHVRARAAAAAAGAPLTIDALGGGLRDASPRVRAAALGSLTNEELSLSGATVERMRVLVADDAWTYVREAAAEALARRARESGQRAEELDAIDRSLSGALEDQAPTVRRAALLALARRNSRASGKAIHRVASDPREAVSVRASAVRALGELCHADAGELLYKLAYRLAAPQLAYDEELGLAALEALGTLGPADLGEKLAPLAVTKGVRALVQERARAAMATTGRCGDRPNR